MVVAIYVAVVWPCCPHIIVIPWIGFSFSFLRASSHFSMAFHLMSEMCGGRLLSCLTRDKNLSSFIVALVGLEPTVSRTGETTVSETARYTISRTEPTEPVEGVEPTLSK